MTTMLRVLIADDERAARAKLVRLLEAHGDVEVVGEATNGREAVEAIRATAPDLVFLDIRMPELNGFQTLEALDATHTATPKIVFVTAFDEYAVRAFDVRAFDYLLKPYDGARLAAALDRVRAQAELEHRPSIEALRTVLDARHAIPLEATLEPNDPPHYLERICIRADGVVHIIRARDIEWVEAYGNYVRLHTATERPLARETIKRLADQLDPARFCRIHRSAIVNLDRIREMKPSVSGDHVIRLDSGIRLRLSRSFRAEVERRLRQL
jgi:two-component system LytT family response regulator